MNIRKNQQKTLLEKETAYVLHIGLFLILLSLLRLLQDILRAAPFTAAAAEDFGAMLEYPVAALMLLTVLCFLLDRVLREKRKNDPFA